MPEKLTKLQLAEYDILKQFIKICEENNLRYYLCYGSMIGAIRHKGFIPWDDDIDVAMPRPDYQKFSKIAKDVLPAYLYFSTYELGKEHITLSSMIMNKNKEFTLHNANKVTKSGAWIDVLAIDGAPKKGIQRKIFHLKFIYRRTMCQLSHFDEVVNLKKKRPLSQRVFIWFAKVTKIERFINPIKAGIKYHKLLSKYDYDNSEEVATFQGDDGLEGIVPKDVYGVGQKYKFEDIEVNGPKDFDRYLKCYYPDYMTPPPLDQRNKHNVKGADYE